MSAITVWTERSAKGWYTCTFSAYAMALEYAGFTNFPNGVNTSAERDAFAGQYNTPAGATLKQVDSQAQARYGTTLPNVTGSLSDALKKPNTALVVTGNYANLNPGGALAKSIVGWGQNVGNVNHAVTVLVNPDGSLTWLDPTAPANSNGVPATAADVLAFNGGNLTNYPVKQIAQGALSPSGTASKVTSGIIAPDSIYTVLGKSPGDTFTSSDVDKLIAYLDSKGAFGLPVVGNVPFASDQAKATVKTLIAPAVGTKLGSPEFISAINNAGFSNAFMGVIGQGLVPEVNQGANTTANSTGAASLINAAADALGKLTNATNWLHLGAMVIGVGLVGFGMWTVVGDLRETGPQGLVSPMPIILKEGV